MHWIISTRKIVLHDHSTPAFLLLYRSMSAKNQKGGAGKAQSGKHGKYQAQGGGSKAKPAKASRPDASEDVKRDQKLQAILLADSFTVTFRPITLECPKVLLPLVNVPMLDYTIEFLTQNGVKEVQLFGIYNFNT